MSEVFIDDKIDHKENDIEKIQTKPNMYISYIGSAGSLHLAKEIINNCIDECVNDNSPGDLIEIVFDETTNTITVADNGRGIPPESMEVACTKLQAGSKFERLAGGSAGENGVGLTACNALASLFEISVKRYGERHTITFHEGKKQGEIKKKKIKDITHGTTVTMQPSKFFMGEESDISSDDLLNWIEDIHYQMSSDITIKVTIYKRGKDAVIKRKFKNEHGLYDLVNNMVKKGISEPVHLVDRLTLDEVSRGKKYKRFIALELAFVHEASSIDTTTKSFCNYVTTVDGGVHEDAVKSAIASYLMKQARELVSSRDLKVIENFKSEDVLQGMTLALALLTDYPPHFSGQTKEKLTNQAFKKPIESMVTSALDKYFKDEPKLLKKIVDKIKANAKARVESTKVRKSVIKGETTNFDEHMMENFEPANNIGKNQYRELFIIEGKSALGSTRNGRFDKDTQAIFVLQGVPLNSLKRSLDTVLENKELGSLVRILGCNIGERFDITKLKYDKIIIMADSDSDGYNITSLMSGFFVMHMPELVKAGKIYKAVGPLYKIRSKYADYVLDKKEFVSIYERHIRESVRLVKPNSEVVYTDNELKRILFNNRQYLEELDRAASHLAMNALLLEFYLIHRDSENFNTLLKERYPEVTIENHMMSGVVENKYQIVILDEIFNKRTERINSLIKNNDSKNMYFDVYEKSGKEYINKGIHSLGSFLKMAHKYEPPIITRFKGLGELNANELCNTTLDPNNRILLQLTTSDILDTLDNFMILHGKDGEARKEMMQSFEMPREDLDN